MISAHRKLRDIEIDPLDILATEAKPIPFEKTVFWIANFNSFQRSLASIVMAVSFASRLGHSLGPHFIRGKLSKPFLPHC